jgi:hypothetical protein
VPDAPDKSHEHNAFKIPNRKRGAEDNQKNRRKNEAPFEALE